MPTTPAIMASLRFIDGLLWYSWLSLIRLVVA
jgi:hypothetical protein